MKPITPDMVRSLTPSNDLTSEQVANINKDIVELAQVQGERVTARFYKEYLYRLLGADSLDTPAMRKAVLLNALTQTYDLAGWTVSITDEHVVFTSKPVIPQAKP